MGTVVRRVIIVDGQRAALGHLPGELAGAHDLHIALITDPQRAVEHVERQRPQLALVDEDVGMDVCRRLRESAPWMTVLVSSTEITRTLRWQALDAGAHRVIRNPVAPDVLLVALVDSARAAAEARATLVSTHLEMTTKIAAQLASRYHRLVPRDEVHALAQMGLCESAARFNPFRCEPFAAFAARRVRGAILDAVRGMTAQSRRQRGLARRVAATRHQLEQRGECTAERIAAELGISVGEVLVADAPNRVTLEPLERDPACDGGERPDHRVERVELLARLVEARHALTGLEAAVIEDHYVRGLALSEIARARRTSVASTLRVHARAIARLRRLFEVAE